MYPGTLWSHRFHLTLFAELLLFPLASFFTWAYKVKVKSLSCVQLLATPWTAAHQAPPSMWFSRQEYWSGEPLPSLANSKFTIARRRIPQREIVATLRTLQLILWDPVGSECFSWGLWDFNLAGGIYQETASVIQDDSRCSLFRNQEICLLSILEYNHCQAVLALQSYPEKFYPQKINRMTLICSPE